MEMSVSWRHPLLPPLIASVSLVSHVTVTLQWPCCAKTLQLYVVVSKTAPSPLFGIWSPLNLHWVVMAENLNCICYIYYHQLREVQGALGSCVFSFIFFFKKQKKNKQMWQYDDKGYTFCHCVCVCVCVWRKWGGNRRVSGVKRKQRAVFPLAATMLLPQHESLLMYYHVQEAGCLLGKWESLTDFACLFALQRLHILF